LRIRPAPRPAAARRPSRALRPGLLSLLASALLVATASAQDGGSAAAIERQFRSGETQLAWQRLDQALAQRPRDAGLRFLKAVLLSETHRPAEAMALLERLTEDYPELPEPYNNLAVLQAAEGHLERARDLLETALRLDPAYRTAHENLGDVYLRLAERAYEAAAAGTRAEPALQTKLRLVRELVDRR
jgi:Flp pilus assembly protein TadD